MASSQTTLVVNKKKNQIESTFATGEDYRSLRVKEVWFEKNNSFNVI